MLGIWNQMHINQFRVGKMDFKVERPLDNEKFSRPPWLVDLKKFWVQDALQWLKQILTLMTAF